MNKRFATLNTINLFRKGGLYAFMTKEEVISEVRLELTGNVLELELNDETLNQIVDKAVREIQRYIDSTKFITIPYARCISLKDFNVSSVSRVFRNQGYGDLSYKGGSLDPFYAQAFFMFSNGSTMYNLSDFVARFSAWNSLLQIRNTISTDLQFVYDSSTQEIYINALDTPAYITLEYVPKLMSVEDIKSDYWIDILVRMSIALAKLYVGRIRTRYSLSNGLWNNDGETLLNEGNSEITSLREKLEINSQLSYIYD